MTPGRSETVEIEECKAVKTVESEPFKVFVYLSSQLKRFWSEGKGGKLEIRAATLKSSAV